MKIKYLLPLLLLLAPALHAQTTYPATSCTTAAIQAALTAEQVSPVNGDIITVPSCSGGSAVTFTTVPNAFSTSVSLTIQGNTTISTNCGTPPTFNTACTATDNTSLIDGRTASNPAPFFSINMTGSSSQVVRVTGFTFTTPNSAFLLNGGEIRIFSAAAGEGQGRIDHNHLIAGNPQTGGFTFVGTTGVADHNVFDADGGNANGVSVNSVGTTVNTAPGDGSTSWNNPTNFGTAGFFFLENNTFNGGFANDCKKAGRYVYRYNVMITSGNSSVQSHATGSDPSGSGANQGRGCRAWEVYGNYFFNATGSSTFLSAEASFQTSGTGLQWNNSETGFVHAINLVEDRDNNGQYTQSAPPTGWGYCGSTFNGSTSGWDGNSPSTALGYPCIDQIGRGKGDLLTGLFNTVCNTTLGCTTNNGQWPNQALEPVYIWMENFTPFSGNSLVTVGSANGNIVNNQDYYQPVTSFNGTSGTGFGLLSARPSSCTNGPSVKVPAGGLLPGVGYWATDTSTFYVCESSAWVVYYTPYTYPHPLVGGTQSTVTISPATATCPSSNLGVSVLCQVFTLSNGSTGSATGLSFSFTGTNPTEFTLINNTCGTSIPGSGSCTVTAYFVPLNTGTRTAQLTFTVTVPVTGVVSGAATLTGTGLATPPAPATMFSMSGTLTMANFCKAVANQTQLCCGTDGCGVSKNGAVFQKFLTSVTLSPGALPSLSAQ